MAKGLRKQMNQEPRELIRGRDPRLMAELVRGLETRHQAGMWAWICGPGFQAER